MDRDSDLSTDDLAQPAGVRQEERPADGLGPAGEDRMTSAPLAPEPGQAPPQEPGGAAAAMSADTRGRTAPDDGSTGETALMDPSEQESFRRRWSEVQTRFVDDPQEAVQTADGLVAELMQSLARGFSEHKGRLESEWQRGGSPDTEDLRRALQRYRSFFDRLLAT
jgi:hypothetical protein